MGLKMPKPHSGLSKNIVFYTKFHSAQQNELYALIQVIHLHPYPINIVSDSSYSVFVLKIIETSTINSNQSIIQQLLLELQSIVKNRTSPIYITHIQTHSFLLTLWLMAMNKLINLSLLPLLKSNMLYYTIILAHYIKFGKFHIDML